MYILYSTRMGGWLSKTSQYTSDFRDAREFPRDEALAMCRMHKQGSSYNMVPVALADLEVI